MPETLSPPTTLNGRYQIERELGRRGLATIYVARDLTHRHLVAVKVIRGDAFYLGGDLFLRRARIGAQLRHPNILAIMDSGEARGPSGPEAAYSVTPFHEGEDLRQRLDRERHLSLEEALRIAGGVATALDFAHQQGVVHGDVKPENILLPNGEPVLADFGVSTVPDREERLRKVSSELMVTGAPAYMSPEQVAGAPPSERSDQYSLAAVLYEMLTGEPPFTGPDMQTVATRVLSEPPRRLTAVRVVPRIVERGIERALSKAPANRFRSVGEFVAALHGASGAPPTAAKTVLPPRRRWRVPLIASLVVLVTGAGVATAARAVISRRAPAAAAHRQLTFSGTATSPALSPDGRSVAYISGGRSLVVQRLTGGDPVAIVPSARSITSARWTGDGNAIVVAMTRDSTERPATFLVAATGGSTRKLLDDVRPFDAGPDSTVIVRASREAGRLELVSLPSGHPTRTIALANSIGAVDEIDWSPDGRWIALTDASRDDLWVVAADSGAPRRVANGARAIRWATSSDALYFLRGPAGTVELMRVGVDAQSGRSTGEAVRVTSLLASDGFDVGRDNRLVHTQTSRDAQLRTFVFGVPGGARRVVEEQPLSEGTARLHDAAISPDGGWVAYGAARGAARDIHVVAFGGGSARVVAASPAREDAPAWSPDGTRLTFVHEDSGGRRVMLADARTGAPRRIGSLPGPGASGGAARWSASGRHIAYYADDLRRVALVNLQRRNESVIRLPANVGSGHRFVVPSPNGTQLIATTRVGGDDETAMWLVFGNGRRWRRITGPFGETFPVAWHRNGWIYLVRNRALATDHGAVHLELWRMRGPGGRPELYATLPEGCGPSVSISADASRGVCSYVRVESDVYVASSLGVR